MGAPLTIPRRTLTVDEYHKIGDAGILRPEDRVELIEGEMIEMAPIGARHFAMVNKLNTLLVAAVGKDGIVSIQNPVVLPPRNEPQPDLAILKPRSDYYRNQLPNAKDILLLIEVADTTLEYDRDAKIPTYAQHAVPEVWLVNVQTNSLSVFLEPSPKGYRRLLTPQAGDHVVPHLLPAVHIAVTEIFS